jgi:hypothetical protein
MFEQERMALIDQLNELQRASNKSAREYEKALRQVKERAVSVHEYFFGKTLEKETSSGKQSKTSTDCERQVDSIHSCFDSLVEKIDESKEKLLEATQQLLFEMDSQINDSMKLLSTKVRLAESRIEKLAQLARSALSAVQAKNAKLKQTVDHLVEERARRVEEEKKLRVEAEQFAKTHEMLLSIDTVMRGVSKSCEAISGVYSKILQQSSSACAADADARKIEEGRTGLARYMHDSAMDRLAEVQALASRLAGSLESPRTSVDSSS